jgi:hypothetical protein
MSEMYDSFNQITEGFEEKVKKLTSGDSALIFKLKSVQGISQVTTLMTELDTIAAEMPGVEKTKFIKRFSDIIPNGAKNHIQEYGDQFNEALVEFLGWGWLKEKYPTHEPKFNHPNSPDLLVYNNDNDPVAAMECKHIRTSDEERRFFERQSHRGGVVNLTTLYSLDTSDNPFLWKLKDTLCSAEKQVNQIRAKEKWIFLDLSPDVVYMPFGIDTLIAHLISDLNNKGINLYAFKQFQVDEPITGTDLA